MATALEKLAKILDLERKSGYRNRAVIGGLEKFLPTWASGAVTEPGGAALVERVSQALADYGQKSAEERAAAVRALLAAEGAALPGDRPGKPPHPPNAGGSQSRGGSRTAI